MNMPLFSVIILCYRHFEYIYSAIDSVLIQDYPNIDLIISDDGSDDFPGGEIETYILRRKGPNIINTVIRQQPQNSGTVRHLNDAIAVCSGRYIVALAADDNFYDAHVLSSYVAGFSAAPENCYVEMAHTGMYDENLEVLEEYYLRPWIQTTIERTETDSTALYENLIHLGACLPSTSTCFKKEFFDQFGKFDENYFLIEDYPTHVRLAREGWVLHFANFVAIKHRHGGISHGQSDALSRSKKLYFEDSIRIIDNITLQNLNALSLDERKNLARRKRRERDWQAFSVARLRGNLSSMIFLALRHPLYSLTVLLNLLYQKAQQYWKRLFVVLIAFWLFAPVAARMLETATGCSAAFFGYIFSIFANVLFVVFALCILFIVLRKLVHAIQRFPTKIFMVGQ